MLAGGRLAVRRFIAVDHPRHSATSSSTGEAGAKRTRRPEDPFRDVCGGCSGAEFSAVVTRWSRGMDPRVCAASLRSLLRPWMTRRWMFRLIAENGTGNRGVQGCCWRREGNDNKKPALRRVAGANQHHGQIAQLPSPGNPAGQPGANRAAPHYCSANISLVLAPSMVGDKLRWISASTWSLRWRALSAPITTTIRLRPSAL
jgi:hypothetical protein